MLNGIFLDTGYYSSDDCWSELELGRRDLFFRGRLLYKRTSLFLHYFSVSLSYFIVAVPMPGCLGKHSCVSSTFPIAILTGTSFIFARKRILALTEVSHVKN